MTCAVFAVCLGTICAVPENGLDPEVLLCVGSGYKWVAGNPRHELARAQHCTRAKHTREAHAKHTRILTRILTKPHETITPHRLQLGFISGLQCLP